MTARPHAPVARLLAAAALLLALAAPARAQAPGSISWTSCPLAGYQCARLDVPLDRSGAVPGTVSLAVARVPASSNPSHSAVVTLAGGPGQAALPMAQDFAAVMQPAIQDRDLLVFDQRGTGSSGALDCPALHRDRSLLAASRDCANELGPSRAFYRTPDSVEDIEALRVAGGYDKLVLFGVSYGTKVALAYAAAHPDHVEALVLDSVVLPEGPDPFSRQTLSSVPRVLADLCAGGACHRATANVDADLAALAGRLRKGSLRGRFVTASGRVVHTSMTQTGLLDILVAGDLNPTLRAELPGSMHAALHHDPMPLLRLYVRGQGLTTGQQAGSAAAIDSDALFLATTCEEAPFAWSRDGSPEQRAQEISAAADAIPREQLGPFSPRAALQGGAIPYCLGWPDAAPPPAAPGALPAVRTLVLDGQMDLRTPFEDAQKLAARIPGSDLVEIPFTGHSVLGADQSTCARDTVGAFFAGQSPAACQVTDNPFRPTPRPPLRLDAVRPIGAKGKLGRTIAAAAATVVDARRQIIGEAIAEGRAPARIGGLRGGTASVSSSSFRLRRYQYVPGVVVSGRISGSGAGTVSVHGGGAASGTLTFSGTGSAHGQLDGHRVTIGAASALRDRLPSLKRVLAQPHLGR